MVRIDCFIMNDVLLQKAWACMAKLSSLDFEVCLFKKYINVLKLSRLIVMIAISLGIKNL